MQTPCAADMTEAMWQRLLARQREVSADLPDDAAMPPVYAPLARRPEAPDGCFVLGRLAQSLDGRIATLDGTSFWISGEEDILHTHRLRALSDAIVVGGGTVQADDPLLTTRHCAGPSPVRVIIDADRRLGADGREMAFRVFTAAPPTLLLCAEDTQGGPTLGTAAVVKLARARDGGLDPRAVIGALRARGLRRIFIEGGGLTVSRFLAAGALDRLHVTIAPLLLGAGIPAFTLPGVARPQEGLRLEWTLHHLGADLLLDIPLQRRVFA